MLTPCLRSRLFSQCNADLMAIGTIVWSRNMDFIVSEPYTLPNVHSSSNCRHGSTCPTPVSEYRHIFRQRSVYIQSKTSEERIESAIGACACYTEK